MKKIAIISDGWKRKNTYNRCEGIYERMLELGDEVSIHRFNCYGNWSADNKFNKGEYNIFSLPVFEMYDAVVLECNNVTNQEIINKIYESVKGLKIPVLDLTKKTGNYYYVGLNNYEAVQKLTDHLIEVHNCKTFAYAGGPTWNYENEMRKQGFLESLKNHNIDISKEFVFDDDWEFHAGEKHFKRLYEMNHKLPEAIVCANDEIAAGFCEAAYAKGFLAPDDYLITGFNGSEKIKYYKPQISTVMHEYKDIGKCTAELILDLWNGKDIEKNNWVQGKISFSESCGCKLCNELNYRDFLRREIVANERAEWINERIASFESGVADARNYQELFVDVAKFINRLGADAFYIILDRRLFITENINVFCTEGYNREKLILAYGLEAYKEIKSDSVEELYHKMDSDKSAIYVYTPIHFRDRTIGYSIVKNSAFLKEDVLFYNIHSIFTRKLHELFQKTILTNVNERLEEVYNKDPLTGLYNRVAYTEIMTPKYTEYCIEGRSCTICFFDVDDFKVINDTKGHSYGDEILRTIASVIEANLPEECLAYRFGGDEFVVFFPMADEEIVEEFKFGITEELEMVDVRVSIGIVYTDPMDGKTLEDYMAVADEEMYSVKASRKANR